MDAEDEALVRECAGAHVGAELPEGYRDDDDGARRLILRLVDLGVMDRPADGDSMASVTIHAIAACREWVAKREAPDA